MQRSDYPLHRVMAAAVYSKVVVIHTVSGGVEANLPSGLPGRCFQWAENKKHKQNVNKYIVMHKTLLI